VSNRRKNLRIEILGQLYGHVVALDVPLAVQNLSAGGFAVDSPIPFYAGTSHQLRFTTSEGQSVSIGAQTAHCLRVRTPQGDTRYLVGFEFTREADDPGDKEAIDTLLDSALSVLTFR
jgi:hypothetical protein